MVVSTIFENVCCLSRIFYSFHCQKLSIVHHCPPLSMLQSQFFDRIFMVKPTCLDHSWCWNHVKTYISPTLAVSSASPAAQLWDRRLLRPLLRCCRGAAPLGRCNAWPMRWTLLEATRDYKVSPETPLENADVTNQHVDFLIWSDLDLLYDEQNWHT